MKKPQKNKKNKKNTKNNTQLKDELIVKPKKQFDRLGFWIILFATIILIGSALAFIFTRDTGIPQNYKYKIIAEYPHEVNDFTQGLFMHNGFVYEGTGRRGLSYVMQKELQTGEVNIKVELPEQFFGEGITKSGKRVIQLTWESEIGFVYDIETLEYRGRFRYQGEGWGITDDGSSLIMSNGSSILTFLNRNTFDAFRRVNVHQGKRVIENLNELEIIDDLIYANVWKTDSIVIIDPEDGSVSGWLDLSGLRKDGDVLNGIAVNEETGNLLVTGKLWSTLYEIEVFPVD